MAITVWSVDWPRQWLLEVNRHERKTELENLRTAAQHGRPIEGVYSFGQYSRVGGRAELFEQCFGKA
jgi:hypothetical protein